MSNISISELLKIIGQVPIIDIRNIESYNNNHIPSARNIQAHDLVNNPTKYLDKNQTYYIYCQKGLRTPSLCRVLARQGFRVVNVLGGYEGWILEK